MSKRFRVTYEMETTDEGFVQSVATPRHKYAIDSTGRNIYVPDEAEIEEIVEEPPFEPGYYRLNYATPNSPYNACSAYWFNEPAEPGYDTREWERVIVLPRVLLNKMDPDTDWDQLEEDSR